MPAPLALPSRALPGIEALGSDHPPYHALYPRAFRWIDAAQEAIAALPVEGALIKGAVHGYLRPADALTLYELAYLARGDVLEMGSAWGLSTSILGRAVHHSGRQASVVSIEIDPNFQAITRNTMQAEGLLAQFEGLAGDATAVATQLVVQRRQFGLVFVDHDHRHEATHQVCHLLAALLPAGCIAVFHDFNDERNRTEPQTYGVYRAISEWLPGSDFTFVGVVGCCGLVQRNAA